MDPHFGSVTLYHESGAAATLLVAMGGETPLESYKNAYQCISDAIAAGWKVAAPGLEEGEQKFVVGYIVRREFEKDGEITPVVDLYSNVEGQNKFKALKVYLNTDDDIAAFEKVSGMTLYAIQPYVGAGDIERGKSSQLDRFVAKPYKTFSAVFIPNPKYDAEEAKKATQNNPYTVPKRRWVRWEGSGQSDQRSQGEVVQDAITKEVEWWKKFFANDPSLAEVNDNVKRLLVPMANKEAKNAVWSIVVVPWKDEVNAEWDPLKGFVLPVPVEYGPDAGDNPAPF